MSYDLIYDSKVSFYEKKVEFDENRTTPVTVLFEQEGVILQADANGEVAFSLMDGMPLHHEVLPVCGRYFSLMYCSVIKDAIKVRMVHVDTVDNYPHCDGEHDRYDEIERDSAEAIFPL